MLKTVAVISFQLLLSHGARPDDNTAGMSMLETVSSGHVVRSHDLVESKKDAIADPLVIPKKDGGLEKGLAEGGFAKSVISAKDAYVAAAKLVWEMDKDKPETPDLNKNFIRQTGADWMKAVSNFKAEASSMRLEAEKTYQEIVASHTSAAKKMMITMKMEMSKLKSLKGYTTGMKDQLGKDPPNEPAPVYYAATKVVGTDKDKDLNTAAEFNKAKEMAGTGEDASKVDTAAEHAAKVKKMTERAAGDLDQHNT